MNQKRIKICIAGAGLAGLSTAVFLKKNDAENLFEIDLVESSPKLGGRAYSFVDRDSGLTLDNGQHILAGWYSATLEFLKICNSQFQLNFQKKLEINFYNTEKKYFKLSCPKIFSPLNLFIGILKFDALGLKDKLRFLKIRKLINREAYSPDYLKKINVSDLLFELKQTENNIRYFWEPFLLAVFNCKTDEINADVFMNVLIEGFSGNGKSNLLIPDKDLNSLFINNAINFLSDNAVEIKLNKRIEEIFKNNQGNFNVKFNSGESNEYSIMINAASFFRLNEIKLNFECDLPKLKTSSIISVHLIFKEYIPEEILKNNSFGMTGLIGTNTQWIFKKSERHLSLVISGADFIEHNGKKLIDLDKEEIIKMCTNDLKNCLSGFDTLEISDSKVIKEKRATFIPNIDSINERKKCNSNIENYYFCGDWAETDLPSTIEAAIRNGKKISEKILKNFYK
ncbi:MAG TPA: FAD-dependent oxidoreductase [Ignavibacteria bacterium]|nr:FAD-dependent oxidoreductase [Ignavibacteria bacterium]